MGLRLVVLNLVSGLVCHVSWSSGHPERPKTQCELHRDSLQGGLSPRGPRPVPGGLAPGAFVPQCDEQGQYRALQCHSSTGHCWCVDSRGQERAGTRTLPRTPPTNCDGPGETCSETQHITCTHLLNTLFKETALKKKVMSSMVWRKCAFHTKLKIVQLLCCLSPVTNRTLFL